MRGNRCDQDGMGFAMSVHRLAKYQTDDPFTRVPNSAVNDPRLDLKSRGLLLLMLSLPDNWVFRERNLAEKAGVGREQVRTAMATLMEAGYVRRRREATDGKPPVTITEVYDTPQIEAKVGNPEVGKPDRRETRPLSNKELEVTKNSTKAAPAARQRNELWDALTEECGWTDKLTKSQQGRVAAAVKELKEVDATADEVRKRAANYRRKYPGMDVTPTAIAANWSAIATPVAQPGGFAAGSGGVYS